MWIVGIFVTLLTMAIFCCLWAALAMIGMAISSRLPWNHVQKAFFVELIRWVLDEPPNMVDVDGHRALNQREDRILKLCVLNKHILEQHSALKGPASRLVCFKVVFKVSYI